MKSEITSLQTLIQNFFLQRLMQHRKVSHETVCSYKDTFKIYLKFLNQKYHVSATEAAIGHFELEYLQNFCIYLEKVRNNKPATINNRIAAIKSFIHYVSEVEPEYSAICKRALMLPAQKQEHPAMDFLTKEEFNSLIAVCDENTFIGARDKLMLLILYNTGVRVSELLAIQPADIHKTSVSIHGKGRKQREIPLWKIP